MTRYTELRHAGYYNPDLTDKERQAIADEVDNGPARTTTPKQSTTTKTTTGKRSTGKRSSAKSSK